ncbi:MAG: hypothetical protein GY866_33555 [Proteobacteria bacterium]|nr:hypothetical protein [Pseudomonadota bacterium]
MKKMKDKFYRIDDRLFAEIVDLENLKRYQSILLGQSVRSLFEKPTREVKRTLGRNKIFSFNVNFDAFGYGVLLGVCKELYYLPYIDFDYCSDIGECHKIAGFSTPITRISEGKSDVLIGTDQGRPNLFGLLSGGQKTVGEYFERVLRIDDIIEHENRILVCGPYKFCDIDGNHLVSLNTLLGTGTISTFIPSPRKLHLHTRGSNTYKNMHRIVEYDSQKQALGKRVLSFPGPISDSISTVWTKLGFLTTAMGNYLQIDRQPIRQTELTNDQRYTCMKLLSSSSKGIEIIYTVNDLPDLCYMRLVKTPYGFDVSKKRMLHGLGDRITGLEIIKNSNFHHGLVKNGIGQNTQKAV